MRIESLTVACPQGGVLRVPLTWVHTLVVGSGAAGLNAAVQLKRRKIDDLLLVTEGLDHGTSINTGSDKQTYYKLSLCGEEADSPRIMAQTFFDGGGMHGDLALVEASQSARAFLHLVDVGVPFPRDPYGQFVGYKTDHDPRSRATSIGPYTSKQMCLALIDEVRGLGIKILERRNAVRLLCLDTAGEERRRAVGVLCIDEHGDFEVFLAENIVLAVGGPGGLYKTSVYPAVHTGGIGLALAEGALAANLPESQFGMASIGFRWNVSGTYMQVIPRFVSTEADGRTGPREFLREYFDSVGDMCSKVFLKGYQWPFDARKVIEGSSLIDILVYIETVVRGRRVFLDYREDPEGFRLEDLSTEARTYLEKSRALRETPLARLMTMNPAAVDLYAVNGIDLASEPLEIAVCSQHNNGGLAANHWWESLNIAHLFPVGEVNGSHGVYRPGGSALNSGQVGGIRAAEFIAARYADTTVQQGPPHEAVHEKAAEAVRDALDFLTRCRSATATWQSHRDEFQRRMSAFGAHIRRPDALADAARAAWRQVEQIEREGCAVREKGQYAEAFRNRQLALAHAVYLDALGFAVASGVGSRGSAIVLGQDGQPIHPELDDNWRIIPEDPAFREQVLETALGADGQVVSRWVPRRPIPESDTWFETAWAKYRSGEIHGPRQCTASHG